LILCSQNWRFLSGFGDIQGHMQGHARLIRASFIVRKLRHMKMGDKTQIIASEQTSGSPTGRKYTSLK